MPIHDSNRGEYNIQSGRINIVTDNGQRVPAYWAHPHLGRRYPGVCLLHDWWGTNKVIRLLASFLAQMGYYVIAPDLFNGEKAQTPAEAMRLIEKSENTRYNAVSAAITVLESHHQVNKEVAAVGIGMGGTLAFEAAIKRDDLEAAISLSGFPQKYLGQFARSNTPILALYGSEEPYTKPVVIEALRKELLGTSLKTKHRVEIIAGAGHDIFVETPTPASQHVGKICMNHVLAFLELHLEHPEQPPKVRY